MQVAVIAVKWKNSAWFGTDHIYSPQTKCIVKENVAFADPNIAFEGDLLLLEMVLSFNIILHQRKKKITEEKQWRMGTNALGHLNPEMFCSRK